ncbi:MAG: hypothetical protein NE327_06295 [Lentisphaeraceae bacterium]|nr:hypothetical protein [Lentisphaeraceae bacterium]
MQQISEKHYEEIWEEVRGKDEAETYIPDPTPFIEERKRSKVVTETDLMPMTIDDYRRDDGSGVIFVRKGIKDDLGLEGTRQSRELIEKIRAVNDKAMMEEHNWNRDQLDEYREDWQKEQARRRKCGKRQKIRGFSKRSRKNLMDQMQTLDFDRLTVKGHCKAKFITLTYPNQYPDFEEAKKHLDNFRKRIMRKFPKASAIWRLEPQKRGAPHFHIILFKAQRIDKEELTKMWGEIVGPLYRDYSYNTMKSYRNGRDPFVRIEAIKSLKGVMWYVSKYISKSDDKDNDIKSHSDPCRTAGFNSATNLTAEAMKKHFDIIETIAKRAYSCGESPIIYQGTKEEENRDFGNWLIAMVDKYAFPDEKEILMPSCGRVWGKFNAKEVDKVIRSTEKMFMTLKDLLCLKRYGAGIRPDLKVNEDSFGFSLYINDDLDREFFYRLLNSRLLECDLMEASPF